MLPINDATFFPPEGKIQKYLEQTNSCRTFARYRLYYKLVSKFPRFKHCTLTFNMLKDRIAGRTAAEKSKPRFDFIIPPKLKALRHKTKLNEYISVVH